MKSIQEAYEKMSLASVAFVLANPTITATLTGFTTYFPVVQATHTQIMAAKILQEADRKGDTATKNQLRATLVAQAMDVLPTPPLPVKNIYWVSFWFAGLYFFISISVLYLQFGV